MIGISRVEYLGKETYVSKKTNNASTLVSFWDGNAPIKAKIQETNENIKVLDGLDKMDSVEITYNLVLGKYTAFNIITIEKCED